MWITYTSQNIPGNQSFDLGFYGTLEDAKDAYVRFCDDVGYDDCSMTLYFCHTDARGEEMRQSAREFEDIGCPFDYPDRLIERGPRGGVLVSRT